MVAKLCTLTKLTILLAIHWAFPLLDFSARVTLAIPRFLSSSKSKLFCLVEQLLKSGKIKFIAPGADCYVSATNPNPRFTINDSEAFLSSPPSRPAVRSRWLRNRATAPAAVCRSRRARRSIRRTVTCSCRPVATSTLGVLGKRAIPPPAANRRVLPSVSILPAAASPATQAMAKARSRRALAQTEYSSANGWFHIGAENNGFFPLIDFQSGKTVISLKTVDTTGSTWMSRMENTINELRDSGITVNGTPATKILDIRVQPGGVAAAQALVDYGKRRNVTVVVKEFP